VEEKPFTSSSPSPPPFSKLILDTWFKDDVTVILLLGVSFMGERFSKWGSVLENMGPIKSSLQKCSTAPMCKEKIILFSLRIWFFFYWKCNIIEHWRTIQGDDTYFNVELLGKRGWGRGVGGGWEL
jgi:hypothetical protein